MGRRQGRLALRGVLLDCPRPAVVVYSLPRAPLTERAQRIGLCGMHLGEMLEGTPRGERAAVLRDLATGGEVKRGRLCERKARGREVVLDVLRRQFGAERPVAQAARDLSGAAAELATLAKRGEALHRGRLDGPTVTTYGDVCARFAEVSAALGLDYDAACAGHAKALAGVGEPAGEEGGGDGGE